ncbi:cupin-like protein [Arenicella xantha]|uniref:Cupin-like protein n=2 Tax=Arenicella xantha TaxID=644221 RepID=A0A395JLS1_9GAMM|nr:cupin-like domain-containing protein [Arenicella xantha]RBP48730.1 cupin-like protein [Arenicella xantha]
MTSHKAIQEIVFESDSALPEWLSGVSQPIVLRGLVRHWPIVQAGLSSSRAAADYLLGFDQNLPLTVYQAAAEADGRIFYNDDMTGFNFDRTRQTLSKVLEALFALDASQPMPSYYVGSTLIDRWLPGFRQHNDLSMGKTEHLMSLWLGNRSRIAAHYDFPCNIACSVVGRRRFTLFAPDQADNLYIGPLDLTPSGQPISLVDAAQPDFGRFPKYRAALESSISVELEPGDALYIPSMWWHQVESLASFNVLINYWWRTTPAYMGSPLNALQLAVLSLRDLPPEQRTIWRDIFDRYVFEQGDEDWQHIPEHARGVLKEIDEATANNIRAQLRRLL